MTNHGDRDLGLLASDLKAAATRPCARLERSHRGSTWWLVMAAESKGEDGSVVGGSSSGSVT